MEKKGLGDEAVEEKTMTENGDLERKTNSVVPSDSPVRTIPGGSTPGQHVRVQVPLATALQGFAMQGPNGEPILGPDGQPVLVRLVPVGGGGFAQQMFVAGKLVNESVSYNIAPSVDVQNGEAMPLANGVHSPTGSLFETSESAETRTEKCSQSFTAPTSIHAPKIVEVESRSARVTWCEPDGDGRSQSNWVYQLEMAHSRDSKFLFVYNGTDVQHLVENLQAGKEYSFRVKAISDQKNSSSSTIISPAVIVTTLSDRPGTPSAPRLGNRTRHSLTIKWSAPPSNGSEIIAYHLEWDQGNPYSGFVEEYKGTQRQHKVSKKLESGHCYRFQVYAENSIGRSNLSPIAAFCTLAGPPSPPGQPFLMNVSVDSISIGWKEPVDSKGESLEYKVEMEDPDSGYGFMSVYCGEALQCTCKNLKKFSVYSFRVTSSNAHGVSKFSAISIFKTAPSEPGAPGVPRLDGRPQPHCVKLIWDLPSDSGGSPVSKYIVELDDGKGSAFQEAHSGSDNFCCISNLLPGRTYRCRVCATSAGGVGQWSKITMVTTRPIAPDGPPPPFLVKGQKPKADSLPLHWKSPDSTGGLKITNYIVQMAERGKSGFADVYSGRDTSFVVNSLQPGRSYRFRVKAKNLIGYGPWSDSALLTTSAAVPDRPDPPICHCRSPYHVLIEWQSPHDNGSRLKQYTLEWIKEKAECVYTGSDLSCEVKGLKPASHNYFRLNASNSVGSSQWSEVVTIVMPPAPPSVVPEVRLLSSTHSALLVTWIPPVDNGSPVSHYVVEVIGIEICQVADTQMFITNLKPETNYRIRVQAVNRVGIGGFSPVLKATTEAQRPLAPLPPELVQGTHNNLKLRWGVVSNPQHLEYCLQMRSPSRTSFQDVCTGLMVAHRVSRLVSDSPYVFRLAVMNKAGRSDWSEEVVYQTTRQPPPVVTGLLCSQCASKSLTLQWDPVELDNTDSNLIYELQCCYPGSEANFRQIYRGADTSFMVDSLQPTTKYRFRVRTCLGNGMVASNSGPQPLYGGFSKVIEIATPEEKVAPVVTPLDKAAVDSNKDVTVSSSVVDETRSEVFSVILTLDRTRTALAVLSICLLLLALLLGYMLV